jgi:transposase
VVANHAKDIPEVKLLMTRDRLYSAIIGEIGDVTRFSNPKKLVSYAGLASRLRESGDLSKMGHISKEGSRTLRWILISCAHSMLRHRGNSKLKEFYFHYYLIDVLPDLC